jgi:hypothetical protein
LDLNGSLRLALVDRLEEAPSSFRPALSVAAVLALVSQVVVNLLFRHKLRDRLEGACTVVSAFRQEYPERNALPSQGLAYSILCKAILTLALAHLLVDRFSMMRTGEALSSLVWEKSVRDMGYRSLAASRRPLR